MPTDSRNRKPTLERRRDDLFLALAHQRRRQVLFCLYDRDNTLTLWDVAAAIVADESGTPCGSLESKEIERVHRSLYHQHIPKLARSGLIEYDDGAELIWLTDLGFGLEPRLRDFVTPGSTPLVPEF